MIAASVTAATTSPLALFASSGTSERRSIENGRTMVAISISTVPETTGVMTLRKKGSHVATTR